MIYKLTTKLVTPYEMLPQNNPVVVIHRMFDSYQDIPVDYTPNNREDPTVVYPEVFDLTGETTPYIITDLLHNKSVYKCYIADPIGFNLTGAIYQDNGTPVDIDQYLVGKRLKLSFFNFWGDLVASKIANAAITTFLNTPAIFAGIYHGVLELLDENNVVLTKLFGMDDATFAVDSYIENTTLTDIYVNTLPIEIVSELPAEGVMGILYLLQTGSPTDPYTEYLYVNGVWNKLGVLDYEDLENIPTINGVQVVGDKNAPEYDLEYDMDTVTHSQIDDIVA